MNSPASTWFEELQKRVLLRKEGVLDVGSSVNFLGRCITRRAGSIEISMPGAYIDKMMAELDMSKCRISTTPGTDSEEDRIRRTANFRRTSDVSASDRSNSVA